MQRGTKTSSDTDRPECEQLHQQVVHGQEKKLKLDCRAKKTDAAFGSSPLHLPAGLTSAELVSEGLRGPLKFPFKHASQLTPTEQE